MKAHRKIAALAATGSLAVGALVGAPAASAQQEGLVNVNVEDVTIQVPIGVAANVCNLDVAVLAELTADEAAPCDATIEQFPRPFRPQA
jgi:hypothetical protein